MVLKLALIILLVQGVCCSTTAQTTAQTTDLQEPTQPTEEADVFSTAATEKGIFAFSTLLLISHE